MDIELVMYCCVILFCCVAGYPDVELVMYCCVILFCCVAGYRDVWNRRAESKVSTETGNW